MDMPVRGKAVSVQELADLWGMKATTIRTYITEGMPVYKQGGKGISHLLSSEDCTQWRMTRFRDDALAKIGGGGGDKPPEADRLKQIKIESAELELAERRGDLVHISDWMPLIEEACVTVRQRLLTIPNDFHSQFTDAPRLGQMTRWLTNKVTASVNSLATALNDVPELADSE